MGMKGFFFLGIHFFLGWWKNIRFFIFPVWCRTFQKFTTKENIVIYYILYVYLLSRLWIYYKWNFEMGIVFEPKCWSVSYGCENWLSRLLPVKQIRFPISTTDGICFVIYVFSEQASFSTTWECKMASASSTSARNLFQDSKTRLSERVQVGWPL